MVLQQDDEYQDREHRDRNRDEDYYENKKTKKPEQTFYVNTMIFSFKIRINSLILLSQL